MKDKKYNYKEDLMALKEEFPEVRKIEVSYQGSGDSFEDFWNEDVFTKDDIESKIKHSDYENLLWYAIDNSDANFNNEGSEGTISIDLENQKLSIDNYFIVRETEASGEKVFE